MTHFTTIAAAAAALALASAPALADRNTSQHPRVGELATLKFEEGSAKISKESREENALGHAAAWAQQNPDGLVVIDGHCSETGSEARNIQLSLARAKSARAQLIEIGVDREQIVLAAYGQNAHRKSVPGRRVVVWGTRSGMDAVVDRSLPRAHGVIYTGMKTRADRAPQPGAVIAKRQNRR